MTTDDNDAPRIYHTSIDNDKWYIEVVRTGSHTCQLAVYAGRGGSLVHTEAVGIGYDERFGPHIADVLDWHAKAVDVIDHPHRRRIDAMPEDYTERLPVFAQWKEAVASGATLLGYTDWRAWRDAMDEPPPRGTNDFPGLDNNWGDGHGGGVGTKP